MGVFFNNLIIYFNEQLSYNYNLKALYLIISVVLSLLFYLLISYFIKAFKISDIQLKY